MRSGDDVLSIIMSVFNGERHLARAIESILAQSYSEFEFLITNDGSTDRSSEILREFSRRDRRIVLLEQENQGLTRSLNNMLARARGEWIARMDADDFSYPDRLSRQLHRLARKDIVLTGCWYTVSDEAGSQHEVIFPDNNQMLARYLHKGINPFPHGGVMFKRSILDCFNPPYRMRYGQDFDLWLRVSEKFRIGNVENVLYHRFDHPSTISRRVAVTRDAQRKLMLRLAEERRRLGVESTDWQSADSQLTEESGRTAPGCGDYERFASARKMLARGRNEDAREELMGMTHADLKTRLLCVMSFLPAVVTRNLFAVRDNINDHRYCIRRMTR